MDALFARPYTPGATDAYRFSVSGSTRGIDVMKRWTGWTLAAMAVAVSVSAGFACDQAAPVAEAKDAKAVAATEPAKGCDMPCCANAKRAADDAKTAATSDEKPCAGHDPKGCPKKAGATAVAVAKAEPAKDAPKAAPSADPGTHR
jgi:hypothetical protein